VKCTRPRGVKFRNRQPHFCRAEAHFPSGPHLKTGDRVVFLPASAAAFEGTLVLHHAHFYHHHAKTPWPEAVERQDFTYLIMNWNELITAECYAPNGDSRILRRAVTYPPELVNNTGASAITLPNSAFLAEI